ncbi:MAG: DUF1015 family protein [Dysgonamonadaceae bacterium]|jgi:uncharacterized protein (DUF1015 family)|nr:DUF1015 family protein [Dysgonamonadaceae bacterium]
MATIKPFRGLRPPAQYAAQIASRPYDVLNSQEARDEAHGNEKSLYHIIRPEIDFPIGIDEHDPAVYQKAAENFKKFQENGWLVQDETENYYIYAQTMNDKTQFGIVACMSIDDYLDDRIKKHELTRHDKEEDRMKHVRINDANIEPVFLAYPDNKFINWVVSYIARSKPEYDFISPDGIQHRLWVIKDYRFIKDITERFSEIPYMYIADGHHRTAAAALVGAEKARTNPNHTGNEEYNYFMAVCFPASQLTIMDYNRLISDLNNQTPDDILDRLKVNFSVFDMGENQYKPARLHNFSLYLSGHWYSLDVHRDAYDRNDPISALDVTISSKLILDEIFGIKDLRSDKRIDFVGGIRGLDELRRRVYSGEMAVALALYPVTMQQLMDVANTGNIMPPKTTWFEPKLRSGLVIHKLS